MSEHHDRSRAQERRGAQRLSGTVNSGSGNGWVRKNDVRSDLFSVEYKTTKAQQYPLKASELKLAHKNALIDGRTMLFGLDMAGTHWIILDEEDFYDLIEQAKEKG